MHNNNLKIFPGRQAGLPMIIETPLPFKSEFFVCADARL
jgi:hypothetical protein